MTHSLLTLFSIRMATTSSATGNVIGIVGSGLAGTMVASLLVKLGFEVHLFEKRSDTRADDEAVSSEFGRSTSSNKRSINLALSYRGMCALQELNLLDSVMKHAIRMPSRIIHLKNGTVTKQAYGKSDEAIWSVSRNLLNKVLLENASNCATAVEGPGSVHTYFGYTLINASKSGSCTFETDRGETKEFQFGLLIGADGAYSTVRESMLRQGRINFSRQYIGHGYKELNIPPKQTPSGPQYALDDVNGLHIWPRGEFMLIALPNPDKSFTATLFAPYQRSVGGFDSVDPNDAEAINSYFKKHFPDVMDLMPDLVEDYRGNPVGSLVTVRVSPWNHGRIVLLGDAAHAVVPFYGQGMNAAFEDALVLYERIKDQLSNTTTTTTSGVERGSSDAAAVDLGRVATEFSALRMPAANALADLCIEHYGDMASNTSSFLYLAHKKFESLVHWMFPTHFVPIYTMVAFTRVPYHEARARGKRQDDAIVRIATWGLGLGVGLGVAALVGAKWVLGVRPLSKTT